MAGKFQGDYLELSGEPTLPVKSRLKKPDKIFISPYLFEVIKNFEIKIKKKKEKKKRGGVDIRVCWCLLAGFDLDK